MKRIADEKCRGMDPFMIYGYARGGELAARAPTSRSVERPPPLHRSPHFSFGLANIKLKETLLVTRDFRTFE